MTIPHRIRALLALRGWTVAQLAQAAGLPHATVATHLRGRTDLTGRTSGRPLSSRPPVEVYAQALGVTVAVLTEAWLVAGVEVEIDNAPGGSNAVMVHPAAQGRTAGMYGRQGQCLRHRWQESPSPRP